MPPTDRTIAWQGSEVQVHFDKLHDADNDQPEVWTLTVDTGSARVVTFWPREHIERLLRFGLDRIGALPDGLVIAGLDDLKDLR